MTRDEQRKQSLRLLLRHPETNASKARNDKSRRKRALKTKLSTALECRARVEAVATFFEQHPSFHDVWAVSLPSDDRNLLQWEVDTNAGVVYRLRLRHDSTTEQRWTPKCELDAPPIDEAAARFVQALFAGLSW